MSKLPLKPLVWTDYYDPGSRTWSSIAPTPWGQHIIRRSHENPNKYTVSYGKGRTREVDTIEDGKDWAENTYHPSAMADWVLSLDEIKKELTQ